MTEQTATRRISIRLAELSRDAARLQPNPTSKAQQKDILDLSHDLMSIHRACTAIFDGEIDEAHEYLDQARAL